jgi:hypothetical protein
MLSPSEERVSAGLGSIDPSSKVEVSVRDLMFVHQVLGELVSFFHQPDHYPTIEHLNRFLGTVETGAYSLLSEAYYKRCGPMLPPEIDERIDNFDLPGTNFDNVP